MTNLGRRSNDIAQLDVQEDYYSKIAPKDCISQVWDPNIQK